MYHVGQEIEYSNGQEATVVEVYDDGLFILQSEDGYAACAHSGESSEGDDFSFCFDDEDTWRMNIQGAMTDLDVYTAYSM